MQEIVPPTIDRFFLEVQLDGLLPSPPSGTQPTLSSVYNAVLKEFHTIPPWIVTLTRSDAAAGQGPLDGAASIVLSLQSVSCTVMENGLSHKEGSLKRPVP